MIRLFKRKAKTTVRQVLNHDDVIKALNIISEQKDISEIIIIYRTNSGEKHYHTSPIDLEMAVYLLEWAKQNTMENGDD
jgi:hypothetical protein